MTDDFQIDSFQRDVAAALPWAAAHVRHTDGPAISLHLTDLARRPDVAAALDAGQRVAREGRALEASARTTWRFGPGPDEKLCFLLHITLLGPDGQPITEPFGVVFRRADDTERQVAAMIARDQVMALSSDPAPPEGQVVDLAGTFVAVTSDLIGTLYEQQVEDVLPELFPWRVIGPDREEAIPAHWLPFNKVVAGDPRFLSLAGIPQSGSTALGMTLAPGLTVQDIGRLQRGHTGIWTITPADDNSRSLYVLEADRKGRLRLRWGITLSVRAGTDPTDELRRLWGRPMRSSVPPTVLLAAIFMARTHRLPVATATAWLPSLLDVQPALHRLADALEGGGEAKDRAFVRALARQAKAQAQDATSPARLLADFIAWGAFFTRPLPAATSLIVALSNASQAAAPPTGGPLRIDHLQRVTALAAVTAWGGPLPECHPGSVALSIMQAVSSRVERTLALGALPASASWLVHYDAPIWLPPPLASESAVPLSIEQRALLRQVAAALVQEAEAGLPPVGRYRVRLPASGLPALTEIAVAALEIDAQDADGQRWLRLAPAEGAADGLVLAWHLSPEPPPAWGAMSPRLAWELHLALCAWERDMRREPAVRLRFVAPSAPASLPAPGAPRRAGRLPKPQLTTPTERVQRIALQPAHPALEGEYADEAEQQHMERTLAAYHRVRDHAVAFRGQQKASPTQREAFRRLPLAYRLARYRVAELPEEGMTVRGLALADDGSVIRGYTRGKLADGAEEQPRPVAAQGLLAVRAALKVVEELRPAQEAETS